MRAGDEARANPRIRQPELFGKAASVGLLATALLLALLGGDNGGGESVSSRVTPRIVEVSELGEAEATVGHPIYWVGPQPDRRLELSVEPDGSVYLRYLPSGAAVGSSSGAYLTVGTYPVADAQAALRRTAASAGAGLGRVADGGIVLENPESAGSVYLAYPGSDLQIEVYDPAPGRAMELIEAGEIRPVG